MKTPVSALGDLVAQPSPACKTMGIPFHSSEAVIHDPIQSSANKIYPMRKVLKQNKAKQNKTVRLQKKKKLRFFFLLKTMFIYFERDIERA